MSADLDDSSSTKKADPVRVQGFAHVGLRVKDAVRSANFYRYVLGAQPLNRPAFKGPGYWLLLGSGPQAIQLHLIQEGVEEGGPEPQPGGAIATNTGDHFALQVVDFDSAERALQDHGIEYSRAYIPAGLAEAKMPRQLFFADPDGHALELCECAALDRFATGPRPSKQEALEAARSYIEGLPLRPSALVVLIVAVFSWKLAANPSSNTTVSSQSPASVDITRFLQSAHEAFDFFAAQNRVDVGTSTTAEPTIQARSLARVLAKLASQAPLYSRPLSDSFQIGTPHKDDDERDEQSLLRSSGSWAGMLAAPFRQDNLCAEIARYSPTSCELDKVAFVAMVVDQLRSKSLVSEMRSVFQLISSQRDDTSPHTILFEDFYLFLTKLGIYLSDSQLRSSYSYLADPASPVGVPFEDFLRLLPHDDILRST